MKFEITISPERIIDAIMSGLEGGIQDWARVACWGRPGRTAERAELDGIVRFACELVEHDGGERTVLHDQWVAGLRLMAERYPRRFAEVVDGTGDATTGNVLYARVVVMRSPRGKFQQRRPEDPHECT